MTDLGLKKNSIFVICYYRININYCFINQDAKQKASVFVILIDGRKQRKTAQFP